MGVIAEALHTQGQQAGQAQPAQADASLASTARACCSHRLLRHDVAVGFP
jgi:hypothetical protein